MRVLSLSLSGQVHAYTQDRGVSGLLHEQCSTQGRHTAEMVQLGLTGLVRGLPFGIALNIDPRKGGKKKKKSIHERALTSE